MLSSPGNATEIDPLQPETCRGQCRFVIARHLSGSWFVSDRFGQVGGIFISEAAARHFAFEESFGHPEEIEVLDEALSFDVFRTAEAA